MVGRTRLLRPGVPFVLSVACLLLLALPGCGGSGLDTVPVTGRVTYQGAPLASGTITFAPEEPKVGRAAWGYLDAEGQYSLTTVRMNDGALPGNYRVAVISFIPGSATAVSRGEPAIPKKFFTHKTSGLSATVDNSTTTLDFDL